MQQNDALIASLQPHQVVQVDPEFVRLKPEVAMELYSHNAAASGDSTAILKSDMPPFELAAAINGLASERVALGGELAGTMKGCDYDAAFPVLVRNLIKPYPLVSWFILAALAGAVISSLASMLNSASTIATMDLYAKFSGEKSPQKLVKVGRIFVVIFVILAAIVAPLLNNFTSIFAFIQEFQGFISPGILAVFILGFFSPRTPRYFGAVGIGINIVAYGALKSFLGPWIAKHGWWYADQIAFLDRMAICFFIVLLAGLILTVIRPMREPVSMPVNDQIELKDSKGAKFAGVIVLIATVALYVIFW
ncbi:hypothetical protein H5P28_05320 [Ruficoccus amylovorans]|uniref:Sodium/glucose cotransporter n=2 Tax=Ruficoccus amylovorans TaxID=1804625 RepID=A0A842HDL5_9BACT|nr:hypothetical protein [Ruficoccus amylovorans]